MSSRAGSLLLLMLVISCSFALFGQQAPSSSLPSDPTPATSTHSPEPTGPPPAVPAAATLREFPVLLQQNVVAGKTAVGTKVQAKLWIATLLEGKVIPRNAVFSGEVVESAPKSGDASSRLSIRMDSVQWKNGSAPVKVYLTAWYYPSLLETGQDLQYGPLQSEKAKWNGQGAYPDPNSRSYKPFPGSEDKDASVPETPSSSTSRHRAIMKDIESAQTEDGGIALTSKHSNIKLDKLTTYVLSTAEPLATK